MEIEKMNLKKKILILIWTALFFVQMLWLSSCVKTEKKFTVHSFDLFDTVTTIVGYAEDKEEFDRIAGEILSELGEYHRLFTIYETYDGLENLCTINEKRTVSVDKRIIDMLLFAKEMHALTDGKVNIAMGSVLSIWHAYREEGKKDPSYAKLPPMDSLMEAAEHTDIQNMVIDAETNTVTLTDSEMLLDVGAIAKGYAVEMAAKSLQNRGISGYLINVGGNVRAVGAKSGESGWIAGIDNPNHGDDYLAMLMLKDNSLVTSGSYQRYYTVDGKEYHHIIDPKTQMPADLYTSVSVVCQSSAMGDALSTALFCMSLSAGKELIESLDGAEAMWVTIQGDIYRSSGFPL